MTAMLERLANCDHLEADAASELVSQLLDESTPDTYIAGVLAALRTKGETGEELLGFTRALLNAAAARPQAPAGAIDTCGTGGDGAGTFNISTAAALVVATCGVPVVKHGNRSVTSRSGSADVLEALGIPFTAPGTALHRRFSFLFAPQYHPALKRIGAVRRALGIRTAFNLVGPLAHPAQPDFQLVGVATRERLSDVARALRGLGRKRAFVVHGEPGLDEATPAGRFTIIDVTPDTIRAMDFRASDFGIASCTLAAIRGGSAAENAGMIEALLQREPGPRRDTVVLNAALALLVAGKADSPGQAAAIATAAIDDGRAAALLQELRASRG